MRALFFLLDGPANASSYHRVLQYLPYFRAHGIDASVSLPVAEPLYARVMESGRHSTPERAVYYASFLIKRLIDIRRAASFDVVVIQRDLFPFGPPLLERLLWRRNSNVVYDTDDATYLRPSFTPRTPFQRLRRFDKVADVVACARWVSVATEPIATWARQFNSNVTVIPMAVDLATYQLVRHRAKAGPPIVGWAGTAGGIRYLEALAPVLRDLARTHEFVMRVISGGYRRVCLPGVPLDARPWKGASSLGEMAEFDVGLVPLHHTPFEQAKFPFKLLQYLALGVPSVSARVGTAASVIQDGENGLLASSPDAWRAAIESLLGDAALRQKLASAGRATVAANYTIERVAPLMVDGLTKVQASDWRKTPRAPRR